MTTTKCIAVVALLVPDYDAAIAFYRDALGFALLEDTPLGDGKRWVRVAPRTDGTALLLAKASGAEQTAATGNQAGDRVAFFLETSDFDADYAGFRNSGVTFLEAPRVEAYGKVAVFADPFGNKWDLIEYRS